MMVVETYQINGPTLKEVVIRIRLVTTSGNGARGIIALHNLCQVHGERERPSLLSLPFRAGSSLIIYNIVGHIHN